MKTEKKPAVPSSEFNFDENIAEKAELRAHLKEEIPPIWSSVSSLMISEYEPQTSGDDVFLGDETPNVTTTHQKGKKYHCHCQSCDKKWESLTVPAACPTCKSTHIAYI
jgi:Zn finger protein HypA/HybF involved in hydrogenase expression